MQPVQRWADNQQQKRHDERKDERPKKMGQDTRKMAKAQFNAIKEESERLAEWFMAKAVQVRLQSQHIRIRAFSRQGVQTTRVSVSPAKGPKARE